MNLRVVIFVITVQIVPLLFGHVTFAATCSQMFVSKTFFFFSS